MVEKQPEKKQIAFINLKALHSLQVNGVLHELLRDIRASRSISDELDRKFINKVKDIINKEIEESKKEELAKEQVVSIKQENTEQQIKKPNYNEKRVFDNNRSNNFNNRPNFNNQRPNYNNNTLNKPNFNNGRPNYNNNNSYNNNYNRDFKKPFNNNMTYDKSNNKKEFNPFSNRGSGVNFASSKLNNFKSFVTETTTVNSQQAPTRTFGNKNKSKQIDEKKALNRKSLLRRNIIVSDSIETDIIMGSRKLVKGKKKEVETFIAPEIKYAVITTEIISVKDLSEKTGKPVTEIIKKLMLLGIMATINSQIDFTTAELVCSDFGITLEQKLDKTFEEKLQDVVTENDEADLVTRAPVVTVMGHVDHGKTSILDFYRKSNIVKGEAGGITQRIGAYQVTCNKQKITFIDTPGHAAFTAMRARGAKVTDIAILVVAADDGIMPQTVEAINHIKAANVPMIVAINKVDKSEANIERVKEQLAENNVLPEEWGGDAILVPVSAKTGFGMDNLLNMILLVSEMQNLKANPNTVAAGVIIEAELDKNRGPVASILVQNGTLKVGDSIVSGITYGKVKAMFDENGKSVKVAEPSMPVAILGFDEVPSSGDQIYAVNEKLSKQVIDERISKIKLERSKTTSGVTLDDFMNRVNEGKLKNLNIIIKADAQGSVEALKQTLIVIRNEEVKVVCIHSGAGPVTESDIILAQASNAVIINFNLKISNKVQSMADNLKVQIKNYNVIYDVVDDITNSITGMLTIKYEEVVVGHAEVRVMFKLSTSGIVAGSYITDGKAIRNAFVRIKRKDELIAETSIESLKVLKDDKAEVNYGYECGIKLKDSSSVKEGDILEIYQKVPVKR